MVTIITYNMQYGTNVSSYLEYFYPHKHLREGATVVNDVLNSLQLHNPDVLGLVEIDSGSLRTKQDCQVTRISEGLGLIESHSKCKYKNILGKFPVLKQQHHALLSKEKHDVMQTYYFRNGVKKAVIMSELHGVIFMLTHLSLNKKTRMNQTKELVNLVNLQDKPVVLMGDFNAEPFSKEIKHLVRKTNLKISEPEVTFPQWNPTKKLDYIFISDSVDVKHAEVLQIPHSDHLPIKIVI